MKLGDGLYLAFSLLAIAAHVLQAERVALVAVVLLCLFLVIEYRRANGVQQIVGAVLFALGVGFAAFADRPWEAVLDGLTRSLAFMVLFFAVAWLQIPAARSPSLRAVRDAIFAQPAGRRFLYLSIGVHGLGAFLNLAGPALLSDMIARQKDAETRGRLSKALMQGFTSASAWSPFYVAVSVVLLAVPGVGWIEIAPYGLVLGAVMIACSFGLDRLTMRRRDAGRPPPAAANLPYGTKRRVLAVLVSLLVLVVGLVEVAGFSIPISLGIVGPPFALIWTRLIAGPIPPVGGVERDLARRVVGGLAALRSEVIVFASANVFGVGVASWLGPDRVGAWLAGTGFGADVGLVALMAVIVGCGFAGLHPVILVILAGEVLPPAALGVSEPAMALALLAVWGVSTVISPFSATTLYLSRVSGVSPYTLAWRWNSAYGLLATVLLAAVVIGFRHLGLV